MPPNHDLTHHDLIRDQFTKQVNAFSEAPGILDEEALKVLVEAARAGPDDSVLDVASGPGIVTCAFAAVAREAVGIDLTPAMVERAETLARKKGLGNAKFQVGDVLPLPFADGRFSTAVCRYSFHHFQDPLGVLREMRRVTRPGGRVAVCDVAVSEDPGKAAAFNRMERLRDPSHVEGMPLSRLITLFEEAGLPPPSARFYRLEADLDGLLSRSFPDPADVPRIREIVLRSLEDDGLGMGARRDGDLVRLHYPIAVLVSRR